MDLVIASVRVVMDLVIASVRVVMDLVLTSVHHVQILLRWSFMGYVSINVLITSSLEVETALVNQKRVFNPFSPEDQNR